MEVNIRLKTWSIVQNNKTKSSEIAGVYEILLPNEKVIAEQSFNGEYYATKELLFSQALLQKVAELEKEIITELKSRF